MSTPRSLSESIDELQRLAAEQPAPTVTPTEAGARAAGQATIEQVAALLWDSVHAYPSKSEDTMNDYRSMARAVLLWAADADPATLAAAVAVAREQTAEHEADARLGASLAQRAADATATSAAAWAAKAAREEAGNG